MVLDAAGFQTRFVDEQSRSRLIFGGHAARMAGATFLAAKGVAVAIIITTPSGFLTKIQGKNYCP